MLTRMLFVVLLFVSCSSNAGVYRWVDAEGRTHFGDRPPAELAPKEVTVEPLSATSDASTRERQQKVKNFLEAQQREREARQTARAEAEQRSAERAEMCSKMRARLTHMKSISTFYRLNEQGERVFVSEADNLQIRENFRKKVEKTCG